MPAAQTTSRDVTHELAFLTRARKAPTLREAIPRLGERAREQSSTHEEILAACLHREVAARESHGGEGLICAARFPSRKSKVHIGSPPLASMPLRRAGRRDRDFIAGRETWDLFPITA